MIPLLLLLLLSLPRHNRLGQFESKTLLLLRSYYENTYRWESGQIKRGCESLPRSTKANLVALLHTNHRRQYWTYKDSEVRLATELGSQARTLHECYPGACARAPRKKGVQSGLWHCQYQVDGAKLACANNVEAAHQKSSPQLQVC